jgi:glycosyltransferase involved in cell wall biosynthesis
MIELSIIIPLFNSKFFILETLSSVSNQLKTLSFQNSVEIIVVDDGSTDDSFEIANNFLLLNLKNFKIFRQTNSGVSAARNLGIKNASGNYVLFLDSDDLLHKNFIDYFLSVKNNENYSHFFNFSYLIDNKIKNNNFKFSKSKQLIPISDFFEFLFKKKIIVSVSILIFKKKLLNLHSLFFNENLNNGEDLIFILNYLLKTNLRFIISNKQNVLLYRIREGSATRSYNSSKFNFLIELIHLRKFFKLHSQLKNLFDNFIIDNFIYVTKSGIKHSNIKNTFYSFQKYLCLIKKSKVFNTFIRSDLTSFLNRYFFLNHYWAYSLIYLFLIKIKAFNLFFIQKLK